MSRFLILSACFLLLLFTFACGEPYEPPESANEQNANEQKEEIKSATAALKLEPTPVSENDVLLAEWDGGEIYLSQLDQILSKERVRIEQTLNNEAMIKRTLINKRSEILKNLVNNYLLLIAARDMGVELSESDKESIARSIKEKFESEEQYQDYLSKIEQTEEELVKVMGQFQLGQKAMEEKVAQLKESMTRKNLVKFYKEKEDFFHSVDRVEVNRIDIYAEDRTLEEAQKLAEKIYKEVKEKIRLTTSFDDKLKIMQDYAYKYSDSPEAQYNWGYCVVYPSDKSAQEVYSTEFLKEIDKQEDGQMSNLFKTKHGYGFFFVRQKLGSETYSFDHPVTQRMLPNMYLRIRLDEWRMNLKEKYGFQYHKENFDGLISESVLKDTQFLSSSPSSQKSTS